MNIWAIKFLAIFLALFSISSNVAIAQSVSLLGDYKDWSAYATADQSNKLCFTISKPKDVSPKPSDYTQSYLYITHRPNENIRNEINFIAGFELAPNSKAIIKVGGQSYDLFVEKDAAWLNDISKGKSLVGQMRAGSTLTVNIISKNNTQIKQTFSLSGVTAATRSIDRQCP